MKIFKKDCSPQDAEDKSLPFEFLSCYLYG